MVIADEARDVALHVRRVADIEEVEAFANRRPWRARSPAGRARCSPRRSRRPRHDPSAARELRRGSACQSLDLPVELFPSWPSRLVLAGRCRLRNSPNVRGYTPDNRSTFRNCINRNSGPSFECQSQYLSKFQTGHQVPATRADISEVEDRRNSAGVVKILGSPEVQWPGHKRNSGNQMRVTLGPFAQSGIEFQLGTDLTETVETAIQHYAGKLRSGRRPHSTPTSFQ